MTDSGRLKNYRKSSSEYIEGRWFNIQIRPDPAASDLLSAGVAFVDECNKLHIRMAKDLTRLKCFYGDLVNVGSFERVSSYFEKSFSGIDYDLEKIQCLSDTFSFTEERYASGHDAYEILSRLYEHTVPIGKKDQSLLTAALERAPRVSPNKFRVSMINKIRNNLPIEKQKFIGAENVRFVDESGEERKLDIPIREPGKMAAAMVSVWTKDKYRRKFSLYSAGLDLDALHSQSSSERLGLFVYRPFNDAVGYSQSLLDQIDDEIDDASWKLRRVADVKLESSADENDLASRISTWVEAA